MESKPSTEEQLKNFYDNHGWKNNADGQSEDANLWEDLRQSARLYVRDCRLRIMRHLPSSGERILDAASGPIQYEEYLELSKGFQTRVCVDISKNALSQAEKKLGDKGEYVLASLLDLPFPDNHFDASLSLHTIYHIEASAQEAAVRELLRVTKPGAPLIIVYANPDRPTHKLKNLLKKDKSGPIYYHAHSLHWWHRFEDSAQIQYYPWRSLTAQLSKRLIPDNSFGNWIFSRIFRLEDNYPLLALKLGAYPMIVMKKKRP